MGDRFDDFDLYETYEEYEDHFEDWFYGEYEEEELF